MLRMVEIFIDFSGAFMKMAKLICRRRFLFIKNHWIEIDLKPAFIYIKELSLPKRFTSLVI